MLFRSVHDDAVFSLAIALHATAGGGSDCWVQSPEDYEDDGRSPAQRLAEYEANMTPREREREFWLISDED